MTKYFAIPRGTWKLMEKEKQQIVKSVPNFPPFFYLSFSTLTYKYINSNMKQVAFILQ